MEPNKSVILGGYRQKRFNRLGDGFGNVSYLIVHILTLATRQFNERKKSEQDGYKIIHMNQLPQDYTDL